MVVKGRRMGTERFQGDREESVCSIAMENREESSPQRQGQDGQQRPLLAESVHCTERLSVYQQPADLIKNHSPSLAKWKRS